MAQSNAILDRAAGKPVRLSTRDKRLVQALALTESERAADIAQSSTMSNISELLKEMDRQKDPARKAILNQEYTAILENVAPFVPEAISMSSQPQEEKSKSDSILDRILNIFKY